MEAAPAPALVKVDRDTQVCISIAARPSVVGSTIFNAAFRALRLNFLYKPFAVAPDRLAGAVGGVRALGIRGCGVSMPHKTEVAQYLDAVAEEAKCIGAVNTIVNDGRRLTGHNTDSRGVVEAIREHYNVTGKDAVVIGAGGVARAAVVALKRAGARTIRVTNRTDARAAQLSAEFGVAPIPYARRHDVECHLLVNATSVGMADTDDELVVAEECVARCQAVMDVIASRSVTPLLAAARRNGCITVAGSSLALHQAAQQFRLYTGLEPPLDLMRTEMNRVLGAYVS